MITTEQALTRIADFSECELHEAVVRAIFDGATLTTVGVRDAQPEDIFIALLAAADSPQRQAVIEGCREVCGRLLKFLNQPTLASDSVHEHAFAHFAALLGVARPPEMARQVRSLLQLALDEAVPITFRNPIVRAAVAYAGNEADVPYWQAHLAGDLIPGYAFQALLRINPQHSRLEGYISTLWCRALRGEVRLRTPLFAKEFAEYQSDRDACLRRVLSRVVRNAPELSELLIKDCARYPSSAKWVTYVEDLNKSSIVFDRRGAGKTVYLNTIFSRAIRRLHSSNESILRKDDNKCIVRSVNEPSLRNRTKWRRGIIVEYSRNDTDAASHLEQAFTRLQNNLQTQASEPPHNIQKQTFG